MFRFLLAATTLFFPAMAQTLRAPNLDVQRAAMKKLDFLVGNWAGQAKLLRAGGETIEVVQTEEVHYKLDGLVLLIEGVGRAKSDGKPALQALGVVSYDDEKGYRFRAFNDGRFLETELKLLDGEEGATWGFDFGQIKTTSILRINDKGEWTELAEVKIDTNAPLKLMELSVHRQP
jgi:hypothetical protein